MKQTLIIRLTMAFVFFVLMTGSASIAFSVPSGGGSTVCYAPD